ncbi:RING finger and CCCH-type zinc finger domain-containing protein roquin [Leptinotarsa decemlineata]|uniref:RING finger and CCCH-type zinc finger domain-containing protein roquin n=1 Tax=Leptinotarsa decemlineata TaxID=7539 RepID=UPI000C25362A|nr:roquin-1 [Leptinotarsa decemlineata]
MPIQAPQWTEFLSCPVCCNLFDEKLRSPISLGCGHTICRGCLSHLHRKQCPFDQTNISIDIEILPVNSALLQLVGPNIRSAHYEIDCKVVPAEFLDQYLECKKCVEDLALYLKPHPSGSVCGSGSILSRPMQRKLVTLINCQLVEDEGRTRAMRAARSLGERTVTELILQHQNPQQLSANLWAAVRARGCQFLGPAMQEEVLKLVLLALEDGSALSRKVLVMFVVQRLEPHFPQASKTSIGHVVQLLYRASCFKVSKRESDSSLMQLKEEFRTYDALRREHDAQIVQIATEAGLRIAPDQWSALLYGDAAHKSHMQSIIDKLQTPQSFAQSVQELVIALQRTGDPGKLSVLRNHLELLAGIDPSPESSAPSWSECSECLEAVRLVVAGLVDFIHQHGNRKLQDTNHSQHAKYKISMCRDLTLRGSCPRGVNCTFAHSPEELEKYRAKSRKTVPRTKDYHIDNQSPTEKNYNSSDDYYSVPNTTTVSPVPLPAVVQIPRMGYDVPYHPNPTYSPAQQFPQPVYPPQAATFPVHEIYPSNHSNVMVTNGGHYYQAQQGEYVNHQQPPQNVDVMKRSNWDAMISQIAKNQNYSPQQKSNRTSTKSLAELHQRKQEVISQLEKVVGKNAATEISNTASTLARQESQHDLDSPTSPYNFWTGQIITGPTFVRSDSILAADDDYVPYETSSISKYGPISRMQKDNGISQSVSAAFRDTPPSLVRRPVSSDSPVASYYYNNNSHFHQAPIPAGHALVGPPGTEGYVQYNNNNIYCQALSQGHNNVRDLYGSQLLIHHPRLQDPSKELIAESHRVKIQLRNLEKQLNDLKIATQGVTNLSDSERLTQELQLIEQGIQEKQKEACLNKIVHSLKAMGNYNNGNPSVTSEDAMYEADIANDMRKLELRLQEELEEWSGEDSPK